MRRLALPLVLALAACGQAAAPVCGDGLVEGTEACDDGNLAPGDGCAATCTVETGYACADGACSPVCGDGMVVGAEVCDGNLDAAHHYCTPDCSGWAGRCDDGVVQPAHEACDDRNLVVGDGCNACQPSFGYTCDAATNTCT